MYVTSFPNFVCVCDGYINTIKCVSSVVNPNSKMTSDSNITVLGRILLLLNLFLRDAKECRFKWMGMQHRYGERLIGDHELKFRKFIRYYTLLVLRVTTNEDFSTNRFEAVDNISEHFHALLNGDGISLTTDVSELCNCLPRRWTLLNRMNELHRSVLNTRVILRNYIEQHTPSHDASAQDLSLPLEHMQL